LHGPIRKKPGGRSQGRSQRRKKPGEEARDGEEARKKPEEEARRKKPGTARLFSSFPETTSPIRPLF
jgi:hypothetical protein